MKINIKKAFGKKELFTVLKAFGIGSLVLFCAKHGVSFGYDPNGNKNARDDDDFDSVDVQFHEHRNTEEKAIMSLVNSSRDMFRDESKKNVAAKIRNIALASNDIYTKQVAIDGLEMISRDVFLGSTKREISNMIYEIGKRG